MTVLRKPLLLWLIVVCIRNDRHGCSDDVAKSVEIWAVVCVTWIRVLFAVGVLFAFGKFTKQGTLFGKFPKCTKREIFW
jgi:hypothetical protein